MSQLLPIPTVELSEPRLPRGNLGKLAWLPVSSLCVDQKYQRAFRSENAKRVREIACAFDWTLFSPIVVASAGAKYAVIDGQHRAAAALAVGAREVPAWVIEADPVAQSKMFIALNATTTKVQSMQLWHARLAARDPDALALFEICRRAGVIISRYPIADVKREPNVTMCPDVISRLRQTHGDGALVATLTLLRLTGEAAQAPLLVRRYIVPCLKIFLAGKWSQKDLEAIAEQLATLDFSQAMNAATQAAKEQGCSYVDCLVDRFLKHTRKLVVSK